MIVVKLSIQILGKSIDSMILCITTHTRNILVFVPPREKHKGFICQIECIEIFFSIRQYVLQHTEYYIMILLSARDLIALCYLEQIAWTTPMMLDPWEVQWSPQDFSDSGQKSINNPCGCPLPLYLLSILSLSYFQFRYRIQSLHQDKKISSDILFCLQTLQNIGKNILHGAQNPCCTFCLHKQRQQILRKELFEGIQSRVAFSSVLTT